MEQKYLLRVWEDDLPEEAWQASLKNIETKEIKFFADIKSFREFFSSGGIDSDSFLTNGDSQNGLSE